VEHQAGELFPRVGFIATNQNLPNRAVVRFYNKRGTAEQWDQRGQAGGEDDAAFCYRFDPIRCLWRRMVAPKRIDKWSLTSLHQLLPSIPPGEGFSCQSVRTFLPPLVSEKSPLDY
jgi:hypothetical protein